MKKEFYKERQEEIKNYQSKPDVLTEEKLQTLPTPIQKHFRLSGFVNKPIAMNANIVWANSFLKLNPKKKWSTMKTIQFNSVNPIMRIAHMQLRPIPFAGKDTYKNGKGTMKGKILNLFTVMNESGDKLTQSALITSFCEFMLLSGYAFQEYVEWKTIDDSTVKGIVTNNGITVSGVFSFDKEGKFQRFETNDRYFSKGKNNYEKHTYIAEALSYKIKNGFYIVDKMRAVWRLPNGDFEYYKGTIDRIDYNVTA